LADAAPDRLTRSAGGGCYDPRVEIDVRFEVDDRAALEAFVSGQDTLHDVVLAALARVPPRMVADVVVQDEYTHDVVLPWDDRTWLVYDTT
jgi:hypothetical protein